eukprot:gb/GFBE01037690.1/.p1 GENE.gb/GFBE01037690.1/~~gb/GFBE01037690.1/.p1  ORF type:complete len:427 (+),score=111.26 gb/GFBE01037690.1/:1-1281(+)
MKGVFRTLTTGLLLAGGVDQAASVKASEASSHEALSLQRSNLHILENLDIPASLENIQTALLELEKQRGSPGLKGTITEIDGMVNNMKEMVTNRSKLTQQTLDIAWSDFLQCKDLYDPSDQSGLQGLDKLADIHADCRLNESGWNLTLGTCETELSARLADEERTKNAFDKINSFPSNGFCAHRNGASDYNTVRGYIQHYRDHFATQLFSWENTFNESQKATEAKVLKLVECYGEDQEKDGKDGYDQSYEDKKKQCDATQEDLENAACDRISHRTDCSTYVACYEKTYNAYFAPGKAKQTAIEDSAHTQSEYRGLMKVGCVLNAYDKYGSGEELTQAIGLCSDTKPDSDFLAVVAPDSQEGAFPPDNRDCMDHDTAHQPGSSDFTEKRYRSLIFPAGEDHWNNVKDEVTDCKGKCCQAPAESETTV